MVPRRQFEERLRVALGRSPVTALLGPRQSGKTTLACKIAGECNGTVFDLECLRNRPLDRPE
jgi:hypothetical protein